MNIEPKTNITVRKRVVGLLIIIFLIQTIIVGRYAYVQIIWSPQLQQWAVDQWTSDTQIAAKRGEILDRNGNPLAVSGNVERVDAFLKEINQTEKTDSSIKQEIADKIAPILNMKPDDIVVKLNKKLKNGLPMASVTIARRIERDQANKIRDLKLPGIVLTEDTKRYYPNGNFLAQVLGSLDSDDNGRSGVERYYNDILKGIPGRFMGETDAYHRELPANLVEYVPPKNGDDIELTIDESIQYFVEKAVEQGLVDYKAKQITAIVMDPKTGDVLAMANKPDFDPNNPVTGSVEDAMKLWRNRAVSDAFEPGSILKVVTAAAAMEENKVSDSDRFVCKGSLKVANRIIKCWKSTGHGVQTFAQILQNSCNVGFMELGARLGKEELYKYYDAFGFGKKTGIDLPAEENGIMIPIQKVGPVELANEAFGQGISVTPIQYMEAFDAVANDGVMVQPHILKEVLQTDDNGNTSVVQVVKPNVVKRVMSVENARKLRGILETVVSIGAGKKAYIPGYHVGGKTGTAQKVVNGVYANGKYISTFVAMAPSSDPKFTIMVSIDEPDPSNYYSGSTAAPIAKTIMEDIFRYMNIQPDTNDIENPQVVNEVVVPEVRGMTLEDAQKLLRNNNISSDTQGTGNIVYDMSPKPGVSVKENTKITLYLGNDKNSNLTVSVPDFSNMTRKEITDTAAEIGLNISFTGDGIGTSQDIQAGTEVKKNSTIKVGLETTDE